MLYVEVCFERILMQAYLNNGGNSAIKEFEIGADYILVKFKTDKIYKYSYKSADVERIEQMKTLALNGSGLNSYINRFVKYDYEKLMD